MFTLVNSEIQILVTINFTRHVCLCLCVFFVAFYLGLFINNITISLSTMEDYPSLTEGNEFENRQVCKSV